MKHMTWGAVALLGVTSLAGCYSYPSDAINNNNYHVVQATPSFQTIRNGDSDQVIVRLVNDNNTGAVTSYVIGNAGAGIAVHYNANYRPVFDATKDTLVPTTDKDAQQYFVVGTAIGRYSYTITPTSVNTGVSTTVNVLVTPRNLGVSLSKHTAVPGDTVVITAPAGLVFSQASAVTFGTGSAATIVARAADSSSITLIVGGGVTGPASVTLVSQPTAPNVAPITLVTGDSLVSTPIPLQIPATVNATSFPFGSTLVVTLGGGIRFNANSNISVGQAAGTGFKILTTDSTQASVTVPTGQNDTVFVSNVYFANYRPAPVATSAGLFSGKTDKVVSTGLAPTVAPATLSATTGGVGSSFTATMTGGVLRFSKGSGVTIGGKAAGITSFSADSLTATILVPQSASGAVAFTNVVAVGNNAAAVSVPSDGKTFASTATFGPVAQTLALTAGALDVTDRGVSACLTGTISAIGGLVCHYYNITLGATTVTTSITFSSTTLQDLGVYLLDATGATCKFMLADNAGANLTGDSGVNAGCTTGTPNTMVAGTYVLVVVDYTASATPLDFRLKVSQ